VHGGKVFYLNFGLRSVRMAVLSGLQMEYYLTDKNMKYGIVVLTTIAVVVGFGVYLLGGKQRTPHLIGVLQNRVELRKLLAEKDKFLGNEILLSGKFFPESLYSARPCIPETGEGCNQPEKIFFYVVDSNTDTNVSFVPEESKISIKRLDLNKKYAEVACKAEGSKYVCNGKSYSAGETVNMRGRLEKEEMPTQTVGNSAGGVTVLKSKTVYFFAID